MFWNIEKLPRRLKKANIEKALEFAWTELNLNDDVWLDVIFNKKLEDVHGFAFADIEDEMVEIEINGNLCEADVLRAIMHEMVHIAQVFEGRLIMAEGNNPPVWMGEYNTSEYADAPWEKEAYSMEETLMEKFYERTAKVLRLDAVQDERRGSKRGYRQPASYAASA